MTDHDFVCWLRGFMAGAGPGGNAADWELIGKQLAAVGPQFVHQGQPRMPSIFNPGQMFGPIVGQAHQPIPMTDHQKAPHAG